MSPRLSIIVPCWNAASSLARTLAGLFAQPEPEALEIIAVDDGSADGTAAILDHAAARHPQLKVLHRANGGVSAARNTGLDAATGDYIGFCDADDVCLPDYTAVMLQALEDADTGIAVCGYHCTAPDGLVTEVHGPADAQKLSRSEALRLLMRGGTLGWALWNKVYRRSVIGDLRFDESIRRTSEDALFNTEAFLRLGSLAVRTVPRPLYDYAVRSTGSLTSAPPSAEKLHETLAVSARIADAVTDAVPELRKYAADMRIRTAVSLASVAYRTGADEVRGGQEELRALQKELRSRFLQNAVNPRLGLKYYAANLLLCTSSSLYKKCCRPPKKSV